jgi:23S rRNA-/tRNA-specific pseudouridylate synthase
MPDSAIETVTVAADETGGRIDRVLAARIPSLSRSRLKALILDGQVTIQGTIEARTILDPSSLVKSGDTITVNLPPPEEATPRGVASSGGGRLTVMVSPDLTRLDGSRIVRASIVPWMVT